MIENSRFRIIFVLIFLANKVLPKNIFIAEHNNDYSNYITEFLILYYSLTKEIIKKSQKLVS